MFESSYRSCHKRVVSEFLSQACSFHKFHLLVHLNTCVLLILNMSEAIPFQNV